MTRCIEACVALRAWILVVEHAMELWGVYQAPGIRGRRVGGVVDRERPVQGGGQHGQMGAAWACELTVHLLITGSCSW
jgi:hypothetical protein